MENISCKIIEDILPLYTDGKCSEESKNAVKLHMSTCEECNKKLEKIKQDLPKIDIKNSNTKLDFKASIFTIGFYGLMYLVFYINQKLNYKAMETYEVKKYMIPSILLSCLLGLMLGFLISYLVLRPKRSVKTIILELIVIDIPALFFLTYSVTIFSINYSNNFLINNLNFNTLFGCLILGCELFRAIKLLLNKRKE